MPTLNILSAVWGNVDVTSQVQSGVNIEDGTYTTNARSNPPGVSDPWVGVQKQFAVLYQYDSGPINLFFTWDDNGVQQISPGTAKSVYLNPTGSTFHDRTNALAIVYGKMAGQSGPVSSSVYDSLYTNGFITFDNNTLGFDGNPGQHKAGVVFYRYGTIGKIYALSNVENGNVYLSK